MLQLAAELKIGLLPSGFDNLIDSRRTWLALPHHIYDCSHISAAVSLAHSTAK